MRKPKFKAGDRVRFDLFGQEREGVVTEADYTAVETAEGTDARGVRYVIDTGTHRFYIPEENVGGRP